MSNIPKNHLCKFTTKNKGESVGIRKGDFQNPEEDIYDYADKIETKEDFINFAQLLAENFTQEKEEWENGKLEHYLEGIYGYVYDTPEKTAPSWKEFAEILLAAKVYE